VGGRLLGTGNQRRCDHPDLTIGGALRGTARPARHALRSQSNGSGGSASRIVASVSKLADAVFSGYVSVDGMELWRSQAWVSAG
jgi:hypothetical protein